MDVYYSARVENPREKNGFSLYRRAGGVYVRYTVSRTRAPGAAGWTYEYATVGKVCEDDPGKMYPNSEYFGLFPEEKRRRVSPPRSLSVGTHVLIERIVEDTGLGEILLGELGRGAAYLFDLASHCVVDEKGPPDFRAYEETHPLFSEDMRTDGGEDSHTEILLFLEEIPIGSDKRFLRRWCAGPQKGGPFVSFAGSDFRHTPYILEYDCHIGRLRDRTLEDFAVAYDGHGVPLFYERLDLPRVGSGEERRAERVAEGLGLGRVDAYVMKGGEFADRIFPDFAERGCGFVMRCDGDSCTQTGEAIEKAKGTFELSEESETSWRGVHAVTLRRRFPNAWGAAEICFHVCFDPAAAAEATGRLDRGLERTRAEMDEKIRTGENALESDFGPFFEAEMSYDEEDYAFPYGRLTGYVERKDRTERVRSSAGYYVLLTPLGTSADEALWLLDLQDDDEALFTDRDGLLADRWETSRQGDRSRYFVEFVALIIRCEIYRTIREKNIISPDTGKRMSVEEALRRLDGIKAEKDESGAYALGDVDETQEEILSAFGITKEDFGRIAAETLRRMGG